MKIIVKKTNKSEKKDFPNSIASIQIGEHYTVLNQNDIEKIIDKLKEFSLAEKGKIIILDWNDGSKTMFESQLNAQKEFNNLKEKAKINHEELDISCLKIIDEYNNID